MPREFTPLYGLYPWQSRHVFPDKKQEGLSGRPESPSCLIRLSRNLERNTQESTALGFSAIVFVTLKECTAQLVEGFEEAVQRVPQITDCRRLFNTPDYIVTVVTRSITEYQELYDDTLSRLPGVLRLNSTIVMKDVIPDRGLPL